METDERQAYIDDEGLSYSGLKMLEVSPAHYRAHKDGLLSKPPTPALHFGKLYDTLIVRPWEFDDLIVLYDGKLTTKEGKAVKEQCQDKIIINSETLDKLTDMRDALMSKATFQGITNNSIHEPFLYWEDEAFGIRCKSAPDFENLSLEILADLKTCVSLDKGKLERDIYNYRYHWQALWCLNGINANNPDKYYRDLVWIFQEKTPPYESRFLRAGYFLDKAREQLKPLLETFKQCQESGEWYGFKDEIEDALPPSWA